VTGVPPTQSWSLLAQGTVAEYAARTALGLVASIKVFDNQYLQARRLKQAFLVSRLYLYID